MTRQTSEIDPRSIQITGRGRIRIRRTATTFLTWAIPLVGDSKLIEVARRHDRSPWIDAIALQSILGPNFGEDLAQVLADEIGDLTMEPYEGRYYRMAREYPSALLRAFVTASIIDDTRYAYEGDPSLVLDPKGPIAK